MLQNGRIKLRNLCLKSCKVSKDIIQNLSIIENALARGKNCGVDLMFFQKAADELEISFIIGTIYKNKRAEIVNRAIFFQAHETSQFYDKRALWGWDKDNPIL